MLKFFPIICYFIFAACNKQESNSPNNKPITYPIASNLANEVSGIADSYRNPGYLWMQEDSNTPAQLSLFKHNGIYIKHISLVGINNRDWEDMCIANGPDPFRKYIYLAETGDNNKQYTQYYFYRFPEPSKEDSIVNNIETIRFQYPDGPHDTEAFLIDPSNNNIYLFTKRENQSQIYLLNYPYSISANNILQKVGQLSYNLVVSAELSPDQKGIAIKTYQRIYYYSKSLTESISQAFQKNPIELNYIPEMQGEAFCFTNNNLGYFTISERVTSDVTLNYYKR